MLLLHDAVYCTIWKTLRRRRCTCCCCVAAGVLPVVVELNASSYHKTGGSVVSIRSNTLSVRLSIVYVYLSIHGIRNTCWWSHEHKAFTSEGGGGVGCSCCSWWWCRCRFHFSPVRMDASVRRYKEMSFVRHARNEMIDIIIYLGGGKAGSTSCNMNNISHNITESWCGCFININLK